MHLVATVPDEEAMRALGASLGRQWPAGTLVLLEGELGAGKTTFVRGVLEGLGHVGAVRSPTFNLIQTYATIPPVMHADLYRLSSALGLGIEEYLDDHLCLIEWPDRLGVVDGAVWVRISFAEGGRVVEVSG
jgi:tRNA threonylcarbamoyladenosine biosynthesis protein TsaE